MLQTERLLIRPFSADDFDDYFSYIMEEELQFMLGLHDVTDRKSAHQTFHWLMENREFLALESRETHRVIGHIVLHPSLESCAASPELAGKAGVSLSFAIAKTERRCGLMEEALRCLIAELFRTNRADYIDCEAISCNAASLGLQKKLGFQHWKTEEFDDVTLLVSLLQK